jgi:hypothetical protein
MTTSGVILDFAEDTRVVIGRDRGGNDEQVWSLDQVINDIGAAVQSAEPAAGTYNKYGHLELLAASVDEALEMVRSAPDTSLVINIEPPGGISQDVARRLWMGSMTHGVGFAAGTTLFLEGSRSAVLLAMNHELDQKSL